MKPWPQDVIRHTAISFHYAFYGRNEAQTAFWAGNSPSTIHTFYKGLVNPQDAQDFMDLKPTNLDFQQNNFASPRPNVHVCDCVDQQRSNAVLETQNDECCISGKRGADQSAVANSKSRSR